MTDPGSARCLVQRIHTCILVLVHEALFDLQPTEEPETPPREGPAEPAIREYQISLIREAFAAAGIDRQDRRQEIAQSCVMRPLSALKELTAAEAHRVLKRINEVADTRPLPEGASAWDLREEETWIDKL